MSIHMSAHISRFSFSLVISLVWRHFSAATSLPNVLFFLCCMFMDFVQHFVLTWYSLGTGKLTKVRCVIFTPILRTLILRTFATLTVTVFLNPWHNLLLLFNGIDNSGPTTVQYGSCFVVRATKNMMSQLSYVTWNLCVIYTISGRWKLWPLMILTL